MSKVSTPFVTLNTDKSWHRSPTTMLPSPAVQHDTKAPSPFQHMTCAPPGRNTTTAVHKSSRAGLSQESTKPESNGLSDAGNKTDVISKREAGQCSPRREAREHVHAHRDLRTCNLGLQCCKLLWPKQILTLLTHSEWIFRRTRWAPAYRLPAAPSKDRKCTILTSLPKSPCLSCGKQRGRE